jgi:glycosyltransferase involved in cell wall biosynthesis
LETRKILNLQLRACQKADKIISPSQFAAGPYTKKVLKWKGSVSVSPNPVVLWNQEVNWEAKQIFHLLYVGRIEYRKGLTFFLAALEKLQEKGLKATVKIIGDNGGLNTPKDKKCRERLKSFLSNYSSPKNGNLKVEMLPHQKHEHLYRYFDWAGLFILPSLSENYPYVALEALSRGCYVIASHTGGIPEIITSKSEGLLFKPGDAGELARHLAYCLKNPKIIRERALGSAEKIKRDFSPELCYKRIIDSYERS